MDYDVLERFFSRKNEVYLVALGGHLYVLKRFKDRRKADAEWSFLNMFFEKLGTPRPIKKEDAEILMEYIKGSLASESINLQILAKLAGWLARLHSFGVRKGDCILRNFIVTEGGKIYGVDWEEAKIDERFEGDLVDVCGSIIWKYYADMGTGFSLCRAFLDFYACKTGRALEDPKGKLVAFFKKRLEYRPELKERITRIIKDLEKADLLFF